MNDITINLNEKTIHIYTFIIYDYIVFYTIIISHHENLKIALVLLRVLTSIFQTILLNCNDITIDIVSDINTIMLSILLDISIIMYALHRKKYTGVAWIIIPYIFAFTKGFSCGIENEIKNNGWIINS